MTDKTTLPEPVAYQWKHPRWTGGEWCITENEARNTKGAEYRGLVPATALQEALDRAERAERARDEAMDAPWPAWAASILNMLQDYGYDPIESDGTVDLAEAFAGYIDGFDEAGLGRRATTAEAALESARKVIEDAAIALRLGVNHYAARDIHGNEVPGDEQYPWIKSMQIARDGTGAWLSANQKEVKG